MKLNFNYECNLDAQEGYNDNAQEGCNDAQEGCNNNALTHHDQRSSETGCNDDIISIKSLLSNKSNKSNKSLLSNKSNKSNKSLLSNKSNKSNSIKSNKSNNIEIKLEIFNDDINKVCNNNDDLDKVCNNNDINKVNNNNDLDKVCNNNDDLDKMKLVELKEMATKLNITLFKMVKGVQKPKLKNELVEDIKSFNKNI
jgi:hypothetical protein